MGTFRHAGWRNLIAFPVDYATDHETQFQPQFSLGANLQYLSEGVREYIGLVVYYALGRMATLFPQP